VTWLPNGTCAGPNVAHSETVYGQTGLAATFWSNRELSGPPSSYALHSSTDGQGMLAGGAWSMRLSGRVNLAAGMDTLTAWFNGDVRIWIDDRLVLDRWNVNNAWNPAGVATHAFTGWHDVRIDYRPTAAGSTGFTIYRGTDPGLGAPFLPAELDPMYGLATASTVHDSGGAAPSTSTQTNYTEPWTAQPSSMVVNPGGLGLTSSFGYESTFRRRVSRTTPKLTVWTYEWYGAAEAPLTNTCANVAPSQAG
jgi:hypothetical protein